MSDSASLTSRQQRAAERILEDEGLTGELSDGLAEYLIHWASDLAIHAAAPQYTDAQADAYIAAIRQAARRAARQAATGQDLIALAQAALTDLAPELQAFVALERQPLIVRRRIESLRVRLISLLSHRIK